MRLKLPITILTGFLWLALAITSEASDPFISEIVAANDKSLKDNFGEDSDWIELHNPGSEPANLLGWGLSDELESPLKWIFPDVSIPPGEFLIVHASGNNIAEPGKPLHTSFRLSRAGEFLGLAKSDGTFSDKYEPGFPALSDNQSYGVPMMGDPDEVIRSHSTFSYLTPASSNAKEKWTETNFKLTPNWKNGRSGFGFQRSGSTLTGLIKTKIPTSKRVIWLRKKFSIKNLETLGQLILRIQFDDGFIAYLNGQKVATMNAVEKPKYSSYATKDNSDLSFFDFDLTEHIRLLKPGVNNVLAVQAFIDRTDRNQFFVMPTLLAARLTAFNSTKRMFLSAATPGRLNTSQSAPQPGDPIFSKPSGSFSSSFSITLKPSVEGRLSATPPTDHCPPHPQKNIPAPLGSQSPLLFAPAVSPRKATAGRQLPRSICNSHRMCGSFHQTYRSS